MNIYDLGFDKNLNKEISSNSSVGFVYDSFEQTPAQNLVFGSLTTGSRNNTFGSDPKSGIWLGAQKFEDAPFKVSQDGVLTSAALAIQPTDFNVSNGASNEVVFSKTITAKLLQTNGGVRITVTGEAPVSTSEVTASVAVTFGGTTIYTSPDLTYNPQTIFRIEVEIFNRNATGSQIAYGKTELYDKTNPSTVVGTFYGQTGITASIDTTADQTLQVTASESGTSGGANPVVNYVLVEKL